MCMHERQSAVICGRHTHSNSNLLRIHQTHPACTHLKYCLCIELLKNGSLPILSHQHMLSSYTYTAV